MVFNDFSHCLCGILDWVKERGNESGYNNNNNNDKQYFIVKIL